VTRSGRAQLLGAGAMACVVGAVFVALLAAPPALSRAQAQETAPGAPTQFQIESDLTCQCGCGLTVHSCNHLNCSSGIPLKNEIAEQLAQGKSRDDILHHFETKYGEKILAAPTTRGFNLAAWTVPFIAIGVGGLVIAVVLARWRRTTVPASERAAEPSALPPAADPVLRARLESALEDYERRS
jgi:cytochrome c-type biogenesis protein CcmH